MKGLIKTYLKILRLISFALAVAFAIPFAASAQDKPEEKKDEDKPTFPLDNFYAKRKPWPIRTFISKFKFSLSTGYGSTFLNHKLTGFDIYQQNGVAPGILPTKLGVPRYSNWVNTVTNDSTSLPDVFRVSSDTAKLGFKGRAFNIPLKATLHFEFLQRYRVGIGYSYELMSMGDYHSISYTDKISGFRPSSPTGFMNKYFVMLGGSFYRLGDYLFTGDLNIGGYSPGTNFNKSLIKKGIYGNIGVTIERDFSEYLRGFVRPSFEMKGYTMSVTGSDQSIKHKLNAMYINVGFTYSLPQLPRCYAKECHAQINHAHGDREYRSRMHKIWKWQNPNYGQNNPKLIRYKGKNKKKLNPY